MHWATMLFLVLTFILLDCLYLSAELVVYLLCLLNALCGSHGMGCLWLHIILWC